MNASSINKDIKDLIKTFLYIISYILFASILIYAVIIDVIANKNVVEGGLTEKIQILLIVGSGTLYTIKAKKNQDFENIYYLIVVLFLLFFVRELDAFFDNMFFHGAWFYVVLEILLLAFLHFKDNWKDVIKEFLEYTKTSQFLLLVFGLVSLTFLSRLMGYKEIWKALFFNIPADNIYDLEEYYRPFKNVAEEGMEVVSYLALFLSALNPFSSHKK